MAKIALALGAFLLCAAVFACPGGNSYTYQVFEIPEPMLQQIGEYIIVNLKKERGHEMDTCHKHNSRYLKKDEHTEKHFNPGKMAGIFMHKLKNSPADIFYGVKQAEAALKYDCTYNILLAKDFAVRRFMLENGTNGPVFEEFISENELMKKMAYMEDYKTVNVLDCEHYLYHVSKTYGKQNFSITLVDKAISEAALQFNLLAPIAGFYRQSCREETLLKP